MAVMPVQFWTWHWVLLPSPMARTVPSEYSATVWAAPAAMEVMTGLTAGAGGVFLAGLAEAGFAGASGISGGITGAWGFRGRSVTLPQRGQSSPLPSAGTRK